MDIPVKYVLHGNRKECEALRGAANRVVYLLDTLTHLGKLEQQTIKVVPYPGSLIVAQKYFGTRVVHIYTGKAVPVEEEGKVECLCNCNFTTGFILEVEPDNLDSNGADLIPLYTVAACYAKRYYRLYRHVLASDFTLYEVGQKVVMIPYQGMSYLCCDPATQTGPTGCRPEESTYDISSDDWRTTYRIIPWCGIRVPKWVRA